MHVVSLPQETLSHRFSETKSNKDLEPWRRFFTAVLVSKAIPAKMSMSLLISRVGTFEPLQLFLNNPDCRRHISFMCNARKLVDICRST